MPPSGTHIDPHAGGERRTAFVPKPLPPQAPLRLFERHYALLGRVNRALGRLDGLAAGLPETPSLAGLLMRKECLLSSRIEGARASFADALAGESGPVKALAHGLARVREGLPLSVRLLRQMHEIMCGRRAEAGQFRRTQGPRDGDGILVPPPPEQLMTCMGELERFLCDEPAPTPLLLKAALAHVQFEMIQPFAEGNGLLARMMLTLLLCGQDALSEPLLCPSLYFHRHREAYRALVRKVWEESDWEGWVHFFLAGLLEAAEQAGAAVASVRQLFESDRGRIRGTGRAAESALRVHELLKKRPLIAITPAAQELGLTRPTVAASLRHLERLDVVREVTGRLRDRRFVYRRYMVILEEGTESA